MLTNYFAFFGLPVHPAVDSADLKSRFYQNSRRFHPDFFTLETDEKQAEVLELSTRNNQAYRTLSDPELRLKHFLELKGALAPEGQNQVPQDFLLEIMDINELLMELEFDPNPAQAQRALDLTTDLEARLDTEARPVLENYPLPPASDEPAALDTLRNYYLKRRYLLRIREKINLPS